MKKIAILVLLLAILPFSAKALNTYDQNTYGQSDVLSYVAMPLAVSSVCDVRGVQTDRVGQLVSYMDQANVNPNDFIDVFRYVPVALVMRTDNRPDFVQWVGDQVNQGVTGPALVTAMETQLRTYDEAVPTSFVDERIHQRYRRPIYDYAYEPDYVPVLIRHHCEQDLIEPLALLDMPVAVADVVDIGVPIGRLGSFVVQLNLGDVPPLQFVELMRYAPAALVVNGGYYGQPDFVQYVQTQVGDGVTGYPLVQSMYQQLPVYGVTPQIDLPPPGYASSQYYVPPVVQNYVDPVSQAYVPPPVRTRIASAFASGQAVSQAAPWQAPAQAPSAAVAAPAQVQRLLNAPNNSAVVVNRAEARRELAQGRAAREAPIAAGPSAVAPAFAARTAAAPAISPREARQQRIAAAPSPAPATISPREARRERVAPAPPAAPTPMISSAPARTAAQPRVQRAERAAPRARALPPPMISSAPARPQFHAAPAQAAPQPREVRPARPAPVARSAPPPVAAAQAPAPRPAPAAAHAAAPAAAAPPAAGGKNEKKGKDH